MKSGDIKRVIESSLSGIETTRRDVDVIMDYIHDADARKPHHISGGIKKTVLVVLCLTLMFSAVAQALSIQIWEAFVTWTQDTFRLESFSRSTDFVEPRSRRFSKKEKATWGNDVCNAFSDIGVYPSLPRYMPNGFEQKDFFYATDESGYSCVDVLYKDDKNHSINLVAELFTSSGYSYTMTIEHDNLHTYSITIDNVTYHFASNLVNNTVAWNDEYGSYCISGNIDMSVLEKMIRSIRGDFASIWTN